MTVRNLCGALAFCLSVGGLAASSSIALAQAPRKPVQVVAAQQGRPITPNERIREEWKARLNENVMTIISGNPNGGYLGIAYDISAVVNDGDELRVLPIVGQGAVQNLRDILFLKGIDMGLVNTVTLSYFKKSGELGTNLQNQVAYISILFQDELHIVARPEINSFADLEGKRVNFSDKGSGAQLAAQEFFKAHKMNVKEYNMGQGDALEAMKKGELDATLCTCLKPLKPYEALATETGFKFLPVPYDDYFQEDYLPAKLTSDDYPKLIPKGTEVNTVAVPTLLAVYNWPKNHERYRRLAKFVDAYFSKFEDFKKKPRHPRWKTVNLVGSLPGWQRFSAAQEWIDTNVKEQTAGTPRAIGNTSATLSEQTKAAFDNFLADYQKQTGGAPLSPEKRNELYAQFSQWLRSQGQTGATGR